MTQKNYQIYEQHGNIFSWKTAYKLISAVLLLVLAGVSGCNSSSNAQSAPTHKWSGQWELKDPYGYYSNGVKLMLTPEGKAYLLPPPGSTPGEVLAYELPVKKVSEKTTLSSGVKVVSLTDALTQSQTTRANKFEGKTYTGAMNRAQQAYILENSKFATSIDELQIGIKSETENYIFQTIPTSNNKSVMNIAKSKKKELSSYIGLVYTVNLNGQEVTVSQLCETSQLLSQTPKMPKAPINYSDKISCPNGFKSLQ
ncbi:MAG: type IV pilin-like G/H family protein [Cyanobacteria bacterium P01_A01_bin.45]